MRCETAINGTSSVIFEDFGILTFYRRRGIFKKCLQQIFSDVLSNNSNIISGSGGGKSERLIQFLVMIIPSPCIWLSRRLVLLLGAAIRVAHNAETGNERLEIQLDTNTIHLISTLFVT